VKVCIVTTTFPRWEADSRGTFVWEAARAVAAQGAQVRVIAMHNPGARTHERLGEIEVIRPRYLWPERWEILQKEGGGLPVMWERSRWTRLVILPFMLAHTLAVWRFARDCDLIHANWTLSAAAALPARLRHRRPLVVTVQGSDMVRATRLPWAASITRQVLRRCDRVLVLSTALRDRALALGIPDGLVHILPNGVDTRDFRPPEGVREAVILFVGALAPIKGVRHLVQCLPRVLAVWPAYRLVLVGEGPQRAELETLAQSLGVADRVDFIGPQSPAQVRVWMQRARVFVLPSVEEGLGVVLLEALATGTPCVASRAGGIPDVVTPEVGLLVPPGNSDALAEAINLILGSSQERYAELSRHARARAETHFSWEVIGARLLEVYRALLGNAA
jgi:glycosyltransferase involved in cell wall biosynthesis